MATLPVTWSAWTNPRIDLYHGTTVNFAESILKDGVNRLRGRERTDFGQGFYTTTWFRAAEVWSETKSSFNGFDPAVMRISLDREALGSLTGIVFVRASQDALDYWNFVSSCRGGVPHRPASNGWYDVAYGPVAQNWRSPATARVWPGYDQISFHTAAAEALLNDPALCTAEVMR